MAWTYQQLFNGLNDGDLNGQDSWSGSTVFDVGTTGTPYEGAKHVSSVLESDTEVTIDRTVTGVTAGTVYVSFKINRLTGTRRGNVYLYKGAALLMRLFFFNDGTTHDLRRLYWNGSTNVFDVIATGLTNNTYYRMGIDWDDSAQPNKYRANIDNGTFSSYQTVVDNATIGAGIDKITLSDLGNNASGTGTIYFDSISPDFTPVTFTFQQLTRDQIRGRRIKMTSY